HVGTQRRVLDLPVAAPVRKQYFGSLAQDLFGHPVDCGLTTALAARPRKVGEMWPAPPAVDRLGYQRRFACGAAAATPCTRRHLARRPHPTVLEAERDAECGLEGMCGLLAATRLVWNLGVHGAFLWVDGKAEGGRER